MKEREEQENEVAWMDHFVALKKRKWLVIIPAVLCAVLAGVISFLSPREWEVDMLIAPGHALVRTEQGSYAEVPVVDPKLVAALVNRKAFDRLLAEDMGPDAAFSPELVAEHLKDTGWVRIAARDRDIVRAKSVLSRLFVRLKDEVDRKAGIYLKEVESQLVLNKYQILDKELSAKGGWNKLKLLDLEINKARRESQSWERKLAISEDRIDSLSEEMKAARERLEGLEARSSQTLAGTEEGADATGRLLQAEALRDAQAYCQTLNDKLNAEKIAQEDARLAISDRHDRITQLRLNRDEARNEIERVGIEIDGLKSQTALLAQRQAGIDSARLVQEPAASPSPVSPKTVKNIILAGMMGLLLFSIVAIVLEQIEKRKT